MSVVVLRGSSLEIINLRIGFLIEPPLQSSPNDVMELVFRREARYAYLNQLTNFLNYSFLWILGKLGNLR
jgi:hypothetical protein